MKFPKSKFDSRSNQVEIMDDLDCKGEVVHQTLRELDTINRLLGGNSVTLKGVKNLLGDYQDKKSNMTVADIGCGGGDILKQISKWSSSKGLNLQLIGIDANENIVRYARENCRDYPNISFITQNIESDEFRQTNCDIIVATLFTHHFSNHQLQKIFSDLQQQSRIGVVINDIHRHWLAYYSILLLTKIFSRSSMVKYDAPLSVLRAFKRSELEAILRDAGIKKFKITWKWAFRWQIIIPSSLA